MHRVTIPVAVLLIAIPVRGSTLANAFATAGYGASVCGGDADGDRFAEIAASPGPGPSASFPSRFIGFDYDGVAIAPLAGFDVTPYATSGSISKRRRSEGAARSKEMVDPLGVMFRSSTVLSV